MLDGLFNNWWRVGGIAGILFLILFIVGIVLQGEAPDFDAPADEIQAWFTDNGEQYLVGDYLIGLGLILFYLPFLSSLRGVLAAAEGGAAVWSRVAFAAGLLFLALAAIATLFWGALAFGFGVVEQGDEGTIRTLMYLDRVGFSRQMILAPLLLASSLVIWQTGVLWRWLALIGLVGAVVVIIGGAASLDSDPEGALVIFGFLGGTIAAIWVLLVSVNMILKREAPAAAS